MSAREPLAPIRLETAALQAWALPPLDADGDKESRGKVLVIAGSREIPGAALLAGEAALRVGAGKLSIATAASVAAQMAFAMPEARVIALPETAGGGFDLRGVAQLERDIAASRAILIGPGAMDGDATASFVQALLPGFEQRVPVQARVVRCQGRERHRARFADDHRRQGLATQVPCHMRQPER